MANSIKFMNEGFEAKYGNIKPDLCEQIYTVLKRLTEANMSPEDEADTKVLYRIYKKKMQNSNAELSPKELQVLDKYNLEEPRTSKDYRGRKDVRSSTRTDSEFRGPNVFEPVRRDGYINRKANLADRAKKMDARSNSRHDIGKYDKDYRLNYMYMKNAVNDKKYNQRKLDNLDKEYDQEESNLRARLNALKNEREQEKSRYNSAIKNSQYEINTLLKRESLLGEEGGYDDYYGGNKEDFVSDLNDIEKALDSVYDSLVTHRAQQMVDDFLYDLDLKRKRAGKVESLNRKKLNNCTNNLQEATISKAMQKLYDMEDGWNFIPGEVYTVVDGGRLTRDRLKFVEIFNDGREEIYKFKPVSQTAVEIAKEEANARGEEYDGFAYLNKESVFYSFFDGLPEKPTPRQKLPDDYVGWTDWRYDGYEYYKKYKNASKNVNITMWRHYGEPSLTISTRIGSDWETVVFKDFDNEEEAKQYVENWISQYKDYINSTPPKKGTKFMIPSYLVDIDNGEISGRLKSRIVDN